MLLFSVNAYSEYTPWFTPSKVSVVLDKGFRVTGVFGVPYTCELEDQVFVGIDHPQYDQIYSMVLAALASKGKVQFEVRKCTVIGWVSNKPMAIIDASSDGEAAIKY
jgi:hypothetical protein